MGEEQTARLLRLIETTQVASDISEHIEMFLQHNRDEELSPTTIVTRQTHLKQFALFCTQVGVSDVSLLTNQFLDQYFVHYRETHKKSTTNTDKRILKVFLTWVRDYKEILIRSSPENIKSAKDKKSDPKFIDREIIEQVIRECPIEQDKFIIAMFAETGIRITELTNIKVSDVKGDEVKIHGKGEKDRTVPITDVFAFALQKFIQNNGRQSDDYLFHSLRVDVPESKITKDTTWRRVKRHFKEIAGINMTPHQLRHSFAINLLMNGCDLVSIQKLLGHEDINTTMIYLRISDLQMKNAYKTHIGKSFLA